MEEGIQLWRWWWNAPGGLQGDSKQARGGGDRRCPGGMPPVNPLFKWRHQTPHSSSATTDDDVKGVTGAAAGWEVVWSQGAAGVRCARVWGWFLFLDENEEVRLVSSLSLNFPSDISSNLLVDRNYGANHSCKTFRRHFRRISEFDGNCLVQFSFSLSSMKSPTQISVRIVPSKIPR
ncbi:hypothetical protein PIB30_013292 [Stylosanthes scabra]|uniref:Uncharacterized protein n=1 Tax=Stylosanthes scabra TaxID=79078 RepID=A0ABU6S722_9FABA|nr:hypothetical protein [Stylosanthes scabra]